MVYTTIWNGLKYSTIVDQILRLYEHKPIFVSYLTLHHLKISRKERLSTIRFIKTLNSLMNFMLGV